MFSSKDSKDYPKKDNRYKRKISKLLALKKNNIIDAQNLAHSSKPHKSPPKSPTTKAKQTVDSQKKYNHSYKHQSVPITQNHDQENICFEILGFEQQSTLQIIGGYANKHHITLSCPPDNHYEIIAQGNHSHLESFFQELQALFGEKLLKGDLVAFFIQKLIRESLTICVAESCTGGVLSAMLTSVNGASQVYKGGITAYSIESKKNILKIQDSILQESGVYSEACVRAMARSAMQLFNADIAIATSGLTTKDTSANNFLKLPAGYVFSCILCKSKLPIVISQNYLSTPPLTSTHTAIPSRLFIQQQASLWAIRLALNALNV